MLPKFENLKELRLSNNKLADEGGEILAKALSCSKTLTQVHASGNKFSALSTRAFANYIRKEKFLKDLDLSHNLIIMEELQELADAFKECHLELLNLRGNLLSSEEMHVYDPVLSAVGSGVKQRFLY